MNSTPSLTEFDPVIPYQRQVLTDIRHGFDYSKGVHEILLSGSVGSAKSILMSHLAITHCLFNPKARVLFARRALPDLKDTLIQKTLEHIQNDLQEGVDFTYNSQRGEFLFSNGSQIISRSWADKNYKKLRSLELSAAFIEELTENDSEEFDNFYKELRARVGRLPKIKETFLCCASNPDSPSHAAYLYFINEASKSTGARWDKGARHTYYSVTTDNPFLPPWYIEQLKTVYTAEECRRMIYGEWLDIKREVIYYAFDESLSLIDEYEIKKDLPIIFTYDFNIGEGKPMSVLFMQFVNGTYYAFDEIVIHTSRTLDTLEEAEARGIFELDVEYIIRGDASGNHRTTNYHKVDYQIIKEFLSGINKRYIYNVPESNPPVRKRHVIVNGILKNANGETKLKIVKSKCPTLIKGLKMSKLKKNGNYIEDDSDYFQHITTALGYAVMRDNRPITASRTINL